MVDLASLLLRKGLGSVARECRRCDACGRTPLAGERMHQMETGSELCELCLCELPEADRRPVRSERVRASERPHAVASRLA
jgi:hypothetical protein